MRVLRAVVVTLLLAGAAAAVAPGQAAANQLVDIAIPDRAGEIPAPWLVRYPQGGPPRAKVLLPDGYDPAKSYPLLVLLIGLASHYSDWSDADKGDIAKTAAGFPGIIVMPEGGDGWYTDWWNGGRRGSPSWESYVLNQVIPQTLERYRIRPERRYHALAGVSMGGLGAGFLGGRLPGFFGSVAVISGFVDLDAGSPYVVGGAQGAAAGALAGKPGDPYAVTGPPGGFYEQGHNPSDLAANYTNTRVFVTTGDGTSPTGVFGGSGSFGSDQAEELAIIHPMSANFATALKAAGVDYSYHAHPGFHDWNNFKPELKAAIAWDFFKPVVEHPTTWVNDTVATRGQLWDVGYRFDTPPDRVVRFRRVDSTLVISAAGSPVTLTTRGGCVLHVATPNEITVPTTPCAGLGLAVQPRQLRAGVRRTLTVRVTPPLPGVVVRFGTARATTDAAGVATLRVCAAAPGARRVAARIADRLPATARVRVRGHAAVCR